MSTALCNFDLMVLTTRALAVRKVWPRYAALFVAIALCKVMTPTLSSLLRKWHFWLTAETPRLVFKRTPSNTDLLSHCVTMTTKKYYPPWYLRSGHLQTLKLARADGEVHPIVHYERQLLDLPDGGQVSLDWALPPRADGSIPSVTELDSKKRTMLILPGLTGGSGELYIRVTVHQMHKLGWQIVVMNARGCASTPLKTAKLFCCAYTDDLRYAVQYLAQKYAFQTEAFVGLGFSMGSNVLVKYLGEEKASTALTAGISVGNPFDLVLCSANFRGTLLNRMTYDKVLASNLKELFFNKSNAHEVFQGYPGVDIEALRNCTTVYDFDHILTRVCFEYETADHYYADASSVKRIPSVSIPLLCINAEDDPISIASALPTDEQVQANPNVVLCVTKSGGHLGFFESPAEASEDPNANATSVWSVRVISEYAESIRLRVLQQQQPQA